MVKISRSKYITSGGLACPLCNSHNIVRGGVNIAAKQLATQDVRCFNCTASWTDSYILNNISKVFIGTSSNLTVVE